MCQLHPKPGKRVRLQSAFPYCVPRDLQEGWEVTVLESEGASVRVTDDVGREFRVPVQCVEREQIYIVEARWRKELHPLVMTEFRARIEELERTRGAWRSGIERINEKPAPMLGPWLPVLRSSRRLDALTSSPVILLHTGRYGE